MKNNFPRQTLDNGEKNKYNGDMGLRMFYETDRK